MIGVGICSAVFVATGFSTAGRLRLNRSADSFVTRVVRLLRVGKREVAFERIDDHGHVFVGQIRFSRFQFIQSQGKRGTRG